MKKYKKVAINIAFLTMLLSVGLNSSYATALNSDSSLNSDSNLNSDSSLNSDSNFDSDINLNYKKSPKYSQARQAKILNTFENGDYQAWQKIIGQNNKINNVIDQVTFQRFTAARVAARNGQYNKALKITERIKRKVENKIA
jgi:hypothetical protein